MGPHPSRSVINCERAYDLAWQTIGNAPFDYVGYGCGDGLKDANFFGSMPSPGQLETLRLMDISASLLIEAYQRLQSLKPEAWVVNLASMSDGLFQRLETPQRPLLLSCLGMLPTLGHRHLLPFLTGQPWEISYCTSQLEPEFEPHWPPAYPISMTTNLPCNVGGLFNRTGFAQRWVFCRRPPGLGGS